MKGQEKSEPEAVISEAESAENPGSGNPGGPTAEEVTPNVAALVAERDRLDRERAELYDQLLRKQAEFENFRKRTEREKKEFRLTASMEVVKALLPVLDGLERALSAPAADSPSELRKGVELLHKQFLKTLEKLGLEPIETRGQKFDPHIHHALEMVESEEHEDQSIVEEIQRGFRFHHRLLRPAMVRVSVRPRKNEPGE